MGWYGNSVYGSPEKFGLEVVGHVEDPQACYSFDDLIVWRHEDGRLFYATDAGCSCPSPFEDYRSIESLTPIVDTAESWASFQKDVDEHCRPCEYDYEKRELVWLPDPQAADKTELLAKVAGLLRNNNKENKQNG